jgi:hypothetical protein
MMSKEAIRDAAAELKSPGAILAHIAYAEADFDYDNNRKRHREQMQIARVAIAELDTAWRHLEDRIFTTGQLQQDSHERRTIALQDVQIPPGA